MRSFVVTVALALYTAVASAQRTSGADSYLARQVPICKANLLANIGPDGSRSHGAKPGVVIASPSTEDPDYVYTWTRDAALVFKQVVEAYSRGEDNGHRRRIDQFVDAQAYLQTVSNPSGSLATGGLGEPKFNIDLTAYTGDWGRPQRDGPPLRATALTGYANWLIKNGNGTEHVKQKVWPVIKLDLDYSAQFWNYTGFDLWEEVSSASFFTTAVQQRALQEGATLAAELGETASATHYQTQAENVLCYQQSYWNPNGGYMTSNTGGGRSGIDANSALASVHNFEPAAGCDAVTFQPCSDKALSSLKVFADSFRQIYPINRGRAANAAVATGRYQEDVYYGGQPWYLTTAVVAEQLYDAIIVWKAEEKITVTPISLAFFRQFAPSVTAGTYAANTATYATLIDAVQRFADGFIEVIAQYTPSDGALSEQYHRDNGAQLSARHLTWSYASILTAHAAREGHAQDSWGAAGLVVPAVCKTNLGPTVRVTFNVRAETILGESIFVVGSIDQLKGWNPDAAVALTPSNYPVWSVTLDIPASTRFSYKYIRKNNGRVTWESDPDRSFESPATGSGSTNDQWK